MLLAFIIPVLYSAFLILVIVGMLRLPKKIKNLDVDATLSVSVIVPFRNEEFRIKPLLESFKRLSYPIEKFEIIFVNDHSEDESRNIVSDFCKNTKILTYLFDVSGEKSGKKTALIQGLSHVKNEFVLFTDADCVVSPQWIKSLVSSAVLNNADMILGPVFMNGKGIISRFQESEFLSLQAITMGTAGFGKSVLCNAANLLIKAEWFNELQNPFLDKVSSGDDIFLMQQVQEKGGRIIYSADSDALVKTPACTTWNELVNQRVRWMSKTKHYTDLFSLFLAGAFGIIQVLYLILVIVLICSSMWSVLGLVILHKAIFDSILLYYTSLKLGVRFSVSKALGLSLIYPLWTLISTLLTIVVKPLWKGRLVKS
jgi:cellulose synthase/poly-beta-1,6-N-acetylglucosamine synthase-like glycosyltransferase